MRSFALLPVLVLAALAAGTGAAGAAGVRAQAMPTAAADPGSVGVRLLDIPTTARTDPRAQQYIVDHLAPGSTVQRRIEVSNTTRDRLRVAVYPAAAGIENGSFLGADGHTANELSTWTAMSRDVLDIAPRGRSTATVTISVPSDAAPGEQYAAVWAEVGAPGESGVLLVNRVGIRMYVSVGEGNAPASSFSIDSLTAQRAPDGQPVVAAALHNTGGRALDMSGTLALSEGPGSLSAGPFPAQLGSTLAPGQSATVTIPLDRQLPDGPWNAALTLRSGLLEEKAEAIIRFPATPGAATPVPAREPAGVPPWLWLLLGVLAFLAALLIALAVVLARRHREDRREDRRAFAP